MRKAISQLSTVPPGSLAAGRSLAIGLLHRSGGPNMVAALRTYAGRPQQAIALICHHGK